MSTSSTNYLIRLKKIYNLSEEEFLELLKICEEIENGDDEYGCSEGSNLIR